MIRYGEYNLLRVSKFVDFGAYLTDGDASILLPGKYVPNPCKLHEELNVFVYLDSEDRPVATTRAPMGVVGDIVTLTVASMTKLGAFLDWGLEKDLFVPFAEMQNKKMLPGKRYTVLICRDDVSHRIVGSNRFDRHVFRKAGPVKIEPGAQAQMLVYDETENGFRVIVNNRWPGMVYKSEVFSPIRLGDRLQGFVFKIREDGKIDLKLREDGRKEVLKHTDEIMKALRLADGFLPYHAKSTPEAIEQRFHMSKKMFKEILGHLYKERKIAIVENGFKLV